MKWSLAGGSAVILAVLVMWGSAWAKPPGGEGESGGERGKPRQGQRPCPKGDGEQSASDRRGPGGPGGPGGHRMPPPPPHPLEAALDTDGDREISADEWAGAVDALKAADKNEDGKLDREELRPPMPPHGFGPPHGPGGRGPGGFGGPGGRGPGPGGPGGRGPGESGPRERGFGPPQGEGPPRGEGRGPRGEGRRGPGQRPPMPAEDGAE